MSHQLHFLVLFEVCKFIVRPKEKLTFFNQYNF